MSNKIFNEINERIYNHTMAYEMAGLKPPPFRIFRAEFHELKNHLTNYFIPMAGINDCDEYMGVKLILVDKPYSNRRMIIEEMLTDMHFLQKQVAECIEKFHKIIGD